MSRIIAYREIMNTEDNIVFTCGRARYELWGGAWGVQGARWYWHKKVSGRVVQSGSYASRRSARRAVLKMITEGG